jgi:hypothetical protein
MRLVLAMILLALTPRDAIVRHQREADKAADKFKRLPAQGPRGATGVSAIAVKLLAAGR